MGKHSCIFLHYPKKWRTQDSTEQKSLRSWGGIEEDLDVGIQMHQEIEGPSRSHKPGASKTSNTEACGLYNWNPCTYPGLQSTLTGSFLRRTFGRQVSTPQDIVLLGFLGSLSANGQNLL